MRLVTRLFIAAAAAAAAMTASAAPAPAPAPGAGELAEVARREAAWAHAVLDKYFGRHDADGDAAQGEWGPSARDARDFADGVGIGIGVGDGAAPRDLQGTACALVAATATGMCGTATACTATGSAAYTTRALTFNTATGIFTGSITTNQCPHIALESTYLGVLRSTMLPTLTCVKQCYPVPSLATSAAALRGPVGFTVRGGMNVYGPNDAGFAYSTGGGAPNICSAPAAQQGFCPAGTDVEMCYANLQVSCGSANAAVTGFASDCGNHANPSHYHTRLGCDYNTSDASAHSPLLAVIKDGRGLYGKWEGNGALPVLDACNGHYGPVPATDLSSSSPFSTTNQFGDTAYPASSASVYHYHVTDQAPFTIGCYGPVNSLAHAKSLYPTCGLTAGAPGCVGCGTLTNTASVAAGSTYKTCTSKGYVEYQLDCPVFRHSFANGTVETFNQIVPTVGCPGCTNCPYPSNANVALTGCLAGASWSASGAWPCALCSTCSGGASVAAACTATSDTVCSSSSAATASATASATATATSTATSTAAAAAATMSATATATATASSTGTSTSSTTLTPTGTPTPTPSPTPSPSGSASTTSTPSPTPTPTSSPTISTSPTSSLSVGATPSNSPSPSPTPSTSGAASTSPSKSPAASPSPTASLSVGASPSATQTLVSATPSPTATSTPTTSASRSPASSSNGPPSPSRSASASAASASPSASPGTVAIAGAIALTGVDAASIAVGATRGALEAAIAAAAAAAAGVPAPNASGLAARITTIADMASGATVFRALQAGAAATGVRVEYSLTLPPSLKSFSGALSSAVAAGGSAAFTSSVVANARAATASAGLPDAFALASASAVAPAAPTSSSGGGASGGASGGSGVGGGVGAAVAIIAVAALAVIFRARLRALLGGPGETASVGPKVLASRPGPAPGTHAAAEPTFENPAAAARLELRVAAPHAGASGV